LDASDRIDEIHQGLNQDQFLSDENDLIQSGVISPKFTSSVNRWPRLPALRGRYLDVPGRISLDAETACPRLSGCRFESGLAHGNVDVPTLKAQVRKILDEMGAGSAR